MAANTSDLLEYAKTGSPSSPGRSMVTSEANSSMYDLGNSTMSDSGFTDRGIASQFGLYASNRKSAPNLTWLWWLLGILALLVALGFLGWLIWWLVEMSKTGGTMSMLGSLMSKIQGWLSGNQHPMASAAGGVNNNNNPALIQDAAEGVKGIMNPNFFQNLFSGGKAAKTALATGGVGMAGLMANLYAKHHQSKPAATAANMMSTTNPVANQTFLQAPEASQLGIGAAAPGMLPMTPPPPPARSPAMMMGPGGRPMATPIPADADIAPDADSDWGFMSTPEVRQVIQGAKAKAKTAMAKLNGSGALPTRYCTGGNCGGAMPTNSQGPMFDGSGMFNIEDVNFLP